MRKISLFTLSAGLLLGTTALSSYAYAQKGGTLQPLTAWSVTNVNSEDGRGYCAIARRFNKNVIMTFARNETKQHSIALDFGDADFETSRSYSVLLDPGAGQQRQFSVQPASNNAFVVKLGTDNPFLEAIKRTGFLRVEVDGEAFNLDLADIDQGEDALNACLAQSLMPAAGSEADAELAVNVEDNKALIRKLEGQVEKMEAENDTLRVSLASKNNNAEAIKAVVEGEQGSALVVRRDSAAKSMILLKKKITSLELTNKTLKETLAMAQGEASSVAGNDQQVVASLAEENKRLKARLDNAIASQVEQEALSYKVKADRENLSVLKQKYKADISDLEMKNKSLNDRLLEVSASAKSLDDLMQRLSALDAQNASLKSQLQIAYSDVDAGAQKIATLEKSVSRLKDAPPVQQDMVETQQLEEALASLRLENSELRAQIVTAVAEKSAKDDEIAALMVEREKAIDGLRIRKAQVEKLSAFKAEYDAVMEQKVSLESELAQARGLERELSGTSAKVTSLKNDLSAKSAEVTSLQNELEALQVAFAAQRSIHEKEIAAHLDDTSGVQALLGQKAAEIDGLEDKLDGATARMSELESQHKADLLEQGSKVEALLQENATLQAKLDDANDAATVAAVQKEAELEAEILALRGANFELTTEMNSVRDSLQSLEVKAGSLGDEVRSKEIARSKALEKVSAYKKDVNDKGQVIADLQAEKVRLQHVVDEKEAVYATLLDQYARLKSGDNYAPQVMSLRADDAVGTARLQQASTSVNTPQKIVLLRPEVSASKAVEIADNVLRTEDVRDLGRDEITRLAAVEPASGETSLAADLEREEASRYFDPAAVHASAAEKQEHLMQSEIVGRSSDAEGTDKALHVGSKPVGVELADDSLTVERVLYAAGIKMDRPFERVVEASSDDVIAYQWGSNDVFGSAIQKPLESAAAFDDQVMVYLSNTEERCSGDFAIVPHSTQEFGAMRIDSYEIACVGDGIDSSASIVFYNKDGVFTAIAHEASTKEMSWAMDARDRILQSMKSNQG